MKVKRIVYISGKAQHGKDTTANFLKDIAEQHGYRVLITHYGDLVKYVAKTFFGWNGVKDKAGRSMLQKIGTDKMRKVFPNFWADFVLQIICAFQDEWDLVLIPDVRFPNEVISSRFYKTAEFETSLIRVVRPYFDNGLTEEQKAHESETAMDDMCYSHIIVNSGDLKFLRKQVNDLAPFIVEDSVDGKWADEE